MRGLTGGVEMGTCPLRRDEKFAIHILCFLTAYKLRDGGEKLVEKRWIVIKEETVYNRNVGMCVYGDTLAQVHTPACSADLTGSNFHLFPTLKEILGGRRHKGDEEVNEAVKEWLNGLAAEVCDEGIQKVVTGCDKYLNIGGDCVEK